MEVEQVPLACEEVLNEGLAELKSIIVRLDRAVVLGDHAHGQVLGEVRARLSKSFEETVGMMEAGEEGLRNEDVTAGGESRRRSASEFVASSKASRPGDCSSYCAELSAEVRPGNDDDEGASHRRRQQEEAELACVAQGDAARRGGEGAPRRVRQWSRGVVCSSSVFL